MSHLLDVRKTVLHQKKDLAFKKLEDLKHEKDVIYSFLLHYTDDEDKRKKEALIIAIQNHDKSKPISVKVDELLHKIMKAEVDYWRLVCRCFVYSDENINLNLNSKELENTKSFLGSLIGMFTAKTINGEISKNAVEFLTNEKCYRVTDDLSREFTAVGTVACIDEMQRVLNVIYKIEANELEADTEDHKTTIDSCVENLQKVGIRMTRTEFIETINANVWATDEENGYNLTTKFDEDKSEVQHETS